jgi:hypothetical protein
MKHTPGPWEVGEYIGTGQPIVTAEARDICAVEDYYKDGAANARLIAAAPDMLEALRDAESAMFHVIADEGFNGPADHSAMVEALHRVREAMKKALV